MNIRYWLSVLPAPICGVMESKYDFWVDDKLKRIIHAEMGSIDMLVSAGFFGKYKNRKFRKDPNVNLLADSGGFQFYFLTEGRQRDFYQGREEMYTFQLRVGDMILGGDIPTGQELDDVQMRKYAAMTRDNIELQFKLGCTPDRFINVLHGISPYSMNVWYEYVKEFGNMGWAVGAKASGALGPIFQLLFLIEKGQMTQGKLIHFFAMSGRRTIWQVFWVFEALGLGDVLTLSSDSSSFSLGRFGSMYYEGGIVRYDEIRAGKKVELWNGEILTDVPRRLTNDQAYDFTLTSVQHFLRWMEREIFQEYENNKPLVEKVVRESGVDKIVKYFKMGGVEAAWQQMESKVGRKNQTRLVDRMFVEGAKRL